LFKLAPNHACVRSVETALEYIDCSLHEEPREYLCITNSDMTTFPEIDNQTVTGKYLIHIKNKWSKQ
jgi:hypothetical protein